MIKKRRKKERTYMSRSAYIEIQLRQRQIDRVGYHLKEEDHKKNQISIER